VSSIIAYFHCEGKEQNRKLSSYEDTNGHSDPLLQSQQTNDGDTKIIFSDTSTGEESVRKRPSVGRLLSISKYIYSI
jgi:hypothetical protein